MTAPFTETPPRASTRRDEARLERFPDPFRRRVRALAATHPRIAQLATTFPGLLAKLAAEPGAKTTKATFEAVIAGASLRRAADVAGLPPWLRALPPEAFTAAPPALPGGDAFSKRIANLVPPPRLAAEWLSLLAEALDLGDEEIALWALQAFLVKPARLRDRRIGPKRRRRARPSRWLVLIWAWHARRSQGLACALARGAWSADLSWETAVSRANAWRDEINLRLVDFDGGPNEAAARVVDGITFVPLTDAAAISQEAHAMRNCLRAFAFDASDGGMRFWSLRREGAPVASMSMGATDAEDPSWRIELKGPRNAPASLDLWRTATRFALDEMRETPPQRACARTPDPARWRATWRSYWLDKRRAGPALPRMPLACGL
jgi:hypothetical protein